MYPRIPFLIPRRRGWAPGGAAAKHKNNHHPPIRGFQRDTIPLAGVQGAEPPAVSPARHLIVVTLFTIFSMSALKSSNT